MNNKSNPIRTAAKRTATALLALAALCACTDDLDTGSKPYVHTPGQLGIAQITLGDNPNLNTRAAASTAPTTAAAPTAPTTRTATEDGATTTATAGKLIVQPNTAITTLQGGDQLMAAYNFSSGTDPDTEAAVDTYTALATRAAAGGAWTLQPASAPGTGQPDAAPVLRPNSGATTGESWAGARLTLSLVGQPADAMAPDAAYDPAATTAQWHAPAGMYATATTQNIGGSGSSSSSDVQVLHFFDALRANTSADTNTDAETNADGAPLRGRVAIDRGTSSPTLGQISASMAHAGALMSLPRTAISGGVLISGGTKVEVTPQSVQSIYAKVNTDKLNGSNGSASDAYVCLTPVSIGGKEHLQAIVPGGATVSEFVVMISQPDPSGGDPILTPLAIALPQAKTLKADYRYPMTLSLNGSTATIALTLPDKPGWGTAEYEKDVTDPTLYIEFVGGTGTSADPLRYTTANALGLRLLQQWMDKELDRESVGYAPKTEILNSTIGSNRLFTHITLTRDIDLNDVEADAAKSNWTPIGNNNGSTPYRGILDGGGHTLKNLRIVNSSQVYQGLIGTLASGGTVKNLTLEDVNISSGGDYVGAVAGQNDGKIESCHVTASATGLSTVTGGSNFGGYTGGITGKNTGSVTKCTNAATVECEYFTGGIAGTNDGGTLTQCTNAATVEGIAGIGGIAGINIDGSIIMACSNSGTIKSQQGNAGGIAGNNSTSSGTTATIVACSNTGNVSITSGSNGGGIAGNQSGAYLYGCWSTGSVTNGAGIVGNSTTIAGCFTTQPTITGGGTPDATNGIVAPNAWNATATNGATTGINILACLNGGIDKYNALPHVTADATLECNHIYIANPKDATQPPVLKYIPDGYEIDSNGQWLIYNAKGLVAFRNQVNKGGDANLALKAQLMADIAIPSGDANKWTEGIGKNDTYAYTGTFDGAGHSISSLRVTVSAGSGNGYTGLFGYIKGGTVKNLRLNAPAISSTGGTNNYVGAVAGMIAGAGRIEHCHVTAGSISAANATNTANAGGIVGVTFTTNGVVMGCSNTGGTVSVTDGRNNNYAGGIVAENYAPLTACCNSATVTATSSTSTNAGGIAGTNNGTLTACWSTGADTATGGTSNKAGGIVGNSGSGSNANACYTTQPISGSGGYSGKGELVSDITVTEYGKMNTAIADWNTSNASDPALQCPYRFSTATGAITKPVTP